VEPKVLGRRLSDKSRKRLGEVGQLGFRLSLDNPPSRPPLSGEGGMRPLTRASRGEGVCTNYARSYRKTAEKASVRKKEIVGALGSREFFRKERIGEAVSANERAKYFLALAGLARAQAFRPAAQPETLKAERASVGVAESFFDEVVPGAHESEGYLLIPHLDKLLSRLFGEVREMIGAVKDCNAPEAQQFEKRLAELEALFKEFQNRLPLDLMPRLLSADRSAGDSVHLLVMDAHKVLNRLLQELAEQNISGALASGISEDDKALIEAFMQGVNRTSPLRFDHPGLGTTATRVGGKLVIQNDIGETDAHVIMLSVAPSELEITYSDVHQKRTDFFTYLLRDLNPAWQAKAVRRTSDLPETTEYYLLRGTVRWQSAEQLKKALRLIGSKLVFLIDWNKARKRLRIFVKGKDAIEILKWAADREVGHRGFLQLGGPEIVYDALELADPGALRPGEPLYQVLGKEATKAFLKEVLFTASTGLKNGDSELLIRDKVKAAFLRFYRSRARGPLGGCHDLVALVVESAMTLRYLLRALWRSDKELMERSRERISRWEAESDELLNRLRKSAAARHAAYETLEPACRLDDVQDHLEESAYLLSLFDTESLPSWLCRRMEEAADLVLRAAQEGYKAVASAQEAFDEAEGLEDFTRSITRLDELSHEAREAERGFRKELLNEKDLNAPLLLLVSDIMRRLSGAAISLARAGFALHRSVFERPAGGRSL